MHGKNIKKCREITGTSSDLYKGSTVKRKHQAGESPLKTPPDGANEICWEGINRAARPKLMRTPHMESFEKIEYLRN